MVGKKVSMVGNEEIQNGAKHEEKIEMHDTAYSTPENKQNQAAFFIRLKHFPTKARTREPDDVCYAPTTDPKASKSTYTNVLFRYK